MNYSDAERVAAYLEKLDLEPAFKNETDSPAKALASADLIVFVTCGVRQSAEDRACGQIYNLKKKYPNKKIILTGCLAHRKDVQEKLEDKVGLFCKIDEFPRKIGKFVESIRHNVSGANKKTKILNTRYKMPDTKNKLCNNYLKITPNYTSSYTMYVPIMTGCNNFCTYCVVPYARGREYSRPAEDILKEVQNLVRRDCKEIILLGQNVNSYKSEFQISNFKFQKTPNARHQIPSAKRHAIGFADLLKMINAIPGDFWISFLTSNPKDMSDELVETIAKSKKVCEYISLAVQSGDNKILKKMNRNYTVGHYKKLIKKIRAAYKKYKPEITPAISTDIIVGFPGETRKQFENTAKLLREIKFDMVYISQYSPRPETAALKMKDNISKQEKKRREKVLTKILEETALARNKKYIGKTVEVLVDKIIPPSFTKGKLKGDFKYLGHARTHKKVMFYSNEKSLVGKFIKVKIAKAKTFGLEGEVIKPNKILVVLGPTSSGKSDIAIKLAKKFNGEIISADSRQVYRGLDLGTGKIEPDLSGEVPSVVERSDIYKTYISSNISHYMIDIVSPCTDYNVAKFKKQTEKIIENILKRGKLPIICGGTGFWIQAIVDNINFPEVKPDWKLRKRLEKHSTEKLFKMLKKIDPSRARTIDKRNKVRLIRAIEITKTLGKVPKRNYGAGIRDYEFLQVGIDMLRNKLYKNIEKRVNTRFKQGMVREVEKLHEQGLSWKKIQSFGLAYYWIPLYLQNKISKRELVDKVAQAEKKYAKRQMTWFRRDEKIKWLKNYKEIEGEVKKFLS